MALLNQDPLYLNDEEKLGFIEEITTNANLVQDRILSEILNQNAKTEYLQRYGLDGAIDRATFKAKIPVVTYEDLQPDIERIANGDHSAIFSGKPVCEFFVSSSTSGGKAKLIPAISDDIHRSYSVAFLIESIIKRNVPGVKRRHRMEFFVQWPERKTPGGLPVRNITSRLYQAHAAHYRSDDAPFAALVHCPDYFQSMYVQFLVGLHQRLQILQIGAGFAGSLVRAINFLRDNWPRLAGDIAAGTLDGGIAEQSLRRSVSDLLKPDPGLASFVSEQCSSADWSGIITRIWPNAKCLRTVVTGSMSQYVPMLEFYGGGLPIVSMLYASTESLLGINLQPMCDPLEVSYTLLPTLAYFEFIPHEPGTGTGTGTGGLIDLTGVEVGKKYELVVTTHAGLYRYQVGDILQVTGFHNAAPRFKFVGRKGMILGVDVEKIDEEELQMAVGKASELLRPYRATVAEHTSHANIKSAPGHLVIYWELMAEEGGKGIGGGVFDGCCSAMEESLNAMYKERRLAGYIGPLEIRIVREGTFLEMMDRALARGASVNQYKVPRCVQLPGVVELLDSRTVSAHFSPALPKLN